MSGESRIDQINSNDGKEDFSDVDFSKWIAELKENSEEKILSNELDTIANELKNLDTDIESVFVDKLFVQYEKICSPNYIGEGGNKKQSFDTGDWAIISLVGKVVEKNPDTLTRLEAILAEQVKMDFTKETLQRSVQDRNAQETYRHKIRLLPGYGLAAYHHLSAEVNKTDGNIITADTAVAFLTYFYDAQEVFIGSTNTIKSSNLHLVSTTYLPKLYDDMKKDDRSRLETTLGKGDISKDKKTEIESLYKKYKNATGNACLEALINLATALDPDPKKSIGPIDVSASSNVDIKSAISSRNTNLLQDTSLKSINTRQDDNRANAEQARQDFFRGVYALGEKYDETAIDKKIAEIKELPQDEDTKKAEKFLLGLKIQHIMDTKEQISELGGDNKRWGTFVDYEPEEIALLVKWGNLVDGDKESCYTFGERKIVKRTDREDNKSYAIPTPAGPTNSLIYRWELQQDFVESFSVEDALKDLTPAQKEAVMTSFYSRYQKIKTSGGYFVDKVGQSNLAEVFRLTVEVETNPSDENKDALEAKWKTIDDGHTTQVETNTNILREYISTDIQKAKNRSNVESILTNIRKKVYNPELKQDLYLQLWERIASGSLQGVTVNNYRTQLPWDSNFLKFCDEETKKLQESTQSQEKAETLEQVQKNYLDMVISVGKTFLQTLESIKNSDPDKYGRIDLTNISKNISNLASDTTLSLEDPFLFSSKMKTYLADIFDKVKLGSLVSAQSTFLETVWYGTVGDLCPDLVINREPDNLLKSLSILFETPHDPKQQVTRQRNRSSPDFLQKISTLSYQYIRAIDNSDQRMFNNRFSGNALLENSFGALLEMDFKDLPGNAELVFIDSGRTELMAKNAIQANFEKIKNIFGENSAQLDAITQVALTKDRAKLIAEIKDTGLVLRDANYDIGALADLVLKAVATQENQKDELLSAYTETINAEIKNLKEGSDDKKLAIARLWIATQNPAPADEAAVEEKIKEFATNYPDKIDVDALIKKYANQLYTYQLEETTAASFRKGAVAYSLSSESEYVTSISKSSANIPSEGNAVDLIAMYGDIEGVGFWDFSDDNYNLFVEGSKIILQELAIAVVSFGVGNIAVKGVQGAKWASRAYKYVRLTRLARKYNAVRYVTAAMKNRSLIGAGVDVLVGGTTAAATSEALRNIDPKYDFVWSNALLEIPKQGLMLKWLEGVNTIFYSKEIVSLHASFLVKQSTKMVIENAGMFGIDVGISLIRDGDIHITKDQLLQNLAITIAFEMLFARASYKNYNVAVKYHDSKTLPTIILVDKTDPKNTISTEGLTKEELRQFIEYADGGGKTPHPHDLSDAAKNIYHTFDNAVAGAPKPHDTTRGNNKSESSRNSPKPRRNVEALAPHKEGAVAIGDLDGKYSSLIDNLKEAGVIEVTGKGADGLLIRKLKDSAKNKKIILLGDVYGEKESMQKVAGTEITNQDAITSMLVALQKINPNITFIAGNHEDILLSMISTQRTTHHHDKITNTMLYFPKKLNPKISKEITDMMERTKLFDICNNRLFFHTSPSEGMLKLLVEGKFEGKIFGAESNNEVSISLMIPGSDNGSLTSRIEYLNKVRQEGVSALVSGKDPHPDFNQLADVVLNPNNTPTTFRNSSNATQINDYIQKLYDMGVDGIAHGHVKHTETGYSPDALQQTKVKYKDRETEVEVDFPIQSIDYKTTGDAGARSHASFPPKQDATNDTGNVSSPETGSHETSANSHETASPLLKVDDPVKTSTSAVNTTSHLRDNISSEVQRTTEIKRFQDMSSQEFNNISDLDRVYYANLLLEEKFPGSVAKAPLRDGNWQITALGQQVIDAHNAGNPAENYRDPLGTNRYIRDTKRKLKGFDEVYGDGASRVLIENYVCGTMDNITTLAKLKPVDEDTRLALNTKFEPFENETLPNTMPDWVSELRGIIKTSPKEFTEEGISAMQLIYLLARHNRYCASKVDSALKAVDQKWFSNMMNDTKSISSINAPFLYSLTKDILDDPTAIAHRLQIYFPSVDMRYGHYQAPSFFLDKEVSKNMFTIGEWEAIGGAFGKTGADIKFGDGGRQISYVRKGKTYNKLAREILDASDNSIGFCYRDSVHGHMEIFTDQLLQGSGTASYKHAGEFIPQSMSKTPEIVKSEGTRTVTVIN